MSNVRGPLPIKSGRYANNKMFVHHGEPQFHCFKCGHLIRNGQAAYRDMDKKDYAHITCNKRREKPVITDEEVQVVLADIAEGKGKLPSAVIKDLVQYLQTENADAQ